MAETAELRLQIEAEIDKLAAECRTGGFDHAARYLAEHKAAVVEIATKARLEPRERALPSPFVYSMQ